MKHSGDSPKDGKEIVMVNLENGVIEKGGIVVDDEKARKSPCHGYDLGDGSTLLFSPGVVGAIDKYEQAEYCKAGMDIKPAPPRLAARIKALREAGVHFRKRKHDLGLDSWK